MKKTNKNNRLLYTVLSVIVFSTFSFYLGINLSDKFKDNKYSFFPNERNIGESYLAYDIYIPDTMSSYQPEPSPGDVSQISRFSIISYHFKDDKKPDVVIDGEFYNASMRDKKIKETEDALPKTGKWVTLGTTAYGKVTRDAYLDETTNTYDYYYPKYTRTGNIYMLKLSVYKNLIANYQDEVNKILLSVFVR